MSSLLMHLHAGFEHQLVYIGMVLDVSSTDWRKQVGLLPPLPDPQRDMNVTLGTQLGQTS